MMVQGIGPSSVVTRGKFRRDFRNSDCWQQTRSLSLFMPGQSLKHAGSWNVVDCLHAPVKGPTGVHAMLWSLVLVLLHLKHCRSYLQSSRPCSLLFLICRGRQPRKWSPGGFATAALQPRPAAADACDQDHVDGFQLHVSCRVLFSVS